MTQTNIAYSKVLKADDFKIGCAFLPKNVKQKDKELSDVFQSNDALQLVTV